MPAERYIGNTPKDAVQSFIDEFCRTDELESKSYSYQDIKIESPSEEHTAADLIFIFTRKESSSQVEYRNYKGYIRETSEGQYVIENWTATIQKTGYSPKPPGITPGRLIGKRPRDRR